MSGEESWKGRLNQAGPARALDLAEADEAIVERELPDLSVMTSQWGREVYVVDSDQNIVASGFTTTDEAYAWIRGGTSAPRVSRFWDWYTRRV